ncbi:hypothetical protein [Sinobaca sp. H24]|uniref:hypothetical protein n=1 Tax=Sinobaca sp. H24 TaxID=2923376 RepID=UPI0020799DF0|nr:hypothetical protein [Sinobaca sp. H24]
MVGVKRRNQWDKELEQLFRELQVEEDTPVEVIAERVESELSTSLKIGFFGSPGSGKSALMNAMIGERKTDTKARDKRDYTYLGRRRHDAVCRSARIRRTG